MAGRVRISSGSAEWQVAVTGSRVTFPDGATLVVHLQADGRVQVDTPDGIVTGVAARAGDRVWVGLGDAVIELTVSTGARRTRSPGTEQDALAAPMAATVVRVNVSAGARVADGDTLIALEAMKMELPIRAPRNGVVRAVLCVEGELVQQGAVLIELEPDEAGG